MANSRAGNYQLEYVLSGFVNPTRSHVHSVYVAPTTAPTGGTPPGDIDLQLLGGGTATLQAFANQYGEFIRAMYPASIGLSSFTLWRYATENQRDFVTAGTLSLTLVGSGSVSVANQQTITYRTAGGSIMKQVLLEANVGGNDKVVAQADDLGDRVEKLIGFTLSADSAIIGIDNTFPVTGLFDSRGENERIWKKIYRQ